MSEQERPILFSTEMIKAIIEGRKTMTRRIMKYQVKDCDHSGFTEAHWRNDPIQWSEAALKQGRAYCSLCGNGIEAAKDNGGIKCPYGKVGDILWVRESFCKMDGDYFFKATVKQPETLKWKPSIHMPKSAARIWLEITGIKIERVQSISEEDAIIEGVELYNNYDGTKCGWSAPVNHRAAFNLLWYKINGEESWNQNPFIWCVSFKVLSTTGKPTTNV